MSRHDGLDVAVIGATGAVGAVFLEVAAERDFPIANLRLLATSRSAGRELRFRGEMITVLETSEEALAGADLVFCSATAAASRQWGPQIAAAGGVLIDDGSAFRMEPNVPLVIPEVNGDDVEWHEGILSIKAEHSEETETGDERFYRRERRFGSLSRRIALPGVVHDSKVDAELKDGVLTLTLVLPEKPKPKQIEIRGS